MNGSYAVESGSRATAETSKLWENEPDPVALLRTRPQFLQRDFERALLGIDESLEMKRVLAFDHIIEGKEGRRGINGPTPTNP